MRLVEHEPIFVPDAPGTFRATVYINDCNRARLFDRHLTATKEWCDYQIGPWPSSWFYNHNEIRTEYQVYFADVNKAALFMLCWG